MTVSSSAVPFTLSRVLVTVKRQVKDLVPEGRDMAYKNRFVRTQFAGAANVTCKRHSGSP